jgi:homoserine O-acetyltransferase
MGLGGENAFSGRTVVPFRDVNQRRKAMSGDDYYSEERHGPHAIFELGNFELESGITLPNAKVAFKTHGTLNESKDNVILFPHMWSGTPKAMEIFLGEDRPLNPEKYFIILPGQFANGFSSSP